MIRVHRDFIGMGAIEAMRLAHRRGLHLEIGEKSYHYAPGRLYVVFGNDGLISDAFEFIDAGVKTSC